MQRKSVKTRYTLVLSILAASAVMAVAGCWTAMDGGRACPPTIVWSGTTLSYDWTCACSDNSFPWVTQVAKGLTWLDNYKSDNQVHCGYSNASAGYNCICVYSGALPTGNNCRGT